MAWMAMAEITFAWIPEGGGGGAFGPSPQANVPGVGPLTQVAASIPNAQVLKLIDSQPIPVSAGAKPSLANINTALTSIVSDMASASGTPLITAAILAQIGNWQSGGP